MEPIQSTSAGSSVPVEASATISPSLSASQARVGQTPIKKTPQDFKFGKVIGEGSYSTVSVCFEDHSVVMNPRQQFLNFIALAKPSLFNPETGVS